MAYRDSDPLPFSQFDRSAKDKARKLADLLKVSYCHGRGILGEFWEANAEPQELERLLADGIDQVRLTADAVRRRFRVASGGFDVDPADLVEAGVLAAERNEFRVKGMWRYFAPVRAALLARESGKAGGIASAKARAAKKGTSQPKSKGRSSTPSATLEGPLEPPLEGPLEGSPKGHRSAAEALVEGLGNQDVRRETEVRSPPPPTEVKATAAAVQREWNAHAKAVGWVEWPVISRRRREALALRFVDEPDLERWRAAIERLSKSQFARGQTKHKYKANPDVLLKPGMVEKILDGAFDDHVPDPRLELLSDKLGVGAAELYEAHVAVPLRERGQDYTEAQLRAKVHGVERREDGVVVYLDKVEVQYVDETLGEPLPGVAFEPAAMKEGTNP